MSDPLAIRIALVTNSLDMLAKLTAIVPEQGRVTTVDCDESAIVAVKAIAQLELLLLDARSAKVADGPLLAALSGEGTERRFAIVLIVDEIRERCISRWREGVIDDVILASGDGAQWGLRMESAVRQRGVTRELEFMREASALHTQTDALTGVLNRATLISMLFRETDRVQRMNTSLGMIQFDIDDFGHWNERLGAIACDDLLLQMVSRVKGLLRSYDLLGRMGKDEFLAALPGCSGVNAALLAERMRIEVFATPFRVAGRTVRLTACFGIAASQGRSPVVVLRETEHALLMAKAAGPETIQCAGAAAPSQVAPLAFQAAPGEDLLAW